MFVLLMHFKSVILLRVDKETFSHLCWWKLNKWEPHCIIFVSVAEIKKASLSLHLLVLFIAFFLPTLMNFFNGIILHCYWLSASISYLRIFNGFSQWRWFSNCGTRIKLWNETRWAATRRFFSCIKLQKNKKKTAHSLRRHYPVQVQRDFLSLVLDSPWQAILVQAPPVLLHVKITHKIIWKTST